MRVVARKVTRYFADGKGFATATAAYLRLAKAELSHEICRDAEWDEDAIRKGFRDRFPFGTCGDYHCCARDPEGMTPRRAFCRIAWKNEIKARAKRIRAMDESYQFQCKTIHGSEVPK